MRTYKSQITTPDTPGEQVWAAGFRLSTPPGHVIRDMPPTLVELTCGGTTWKQERRRRGNPKTRPYYVAVVDEDGTADLRRQVERKYVRVFLDPADAHLAYLDDVDREAARVEKHMTTLRELATRLEIIKKEVRNS